VSAQLVADVATLVDSGDEADQILRAVVARLAEAPGVERVAIEFVEPDGALVGPSAGRSTGGEPARTPILFQRDEVAHLLIEGRPLDPATAAEIARLVAPYCLVGWDTGGEDWDVD
jgi:hypothetical protein